MTIKSVSDIQANDLIDSFTCGGVKIVMAWVDSGRKVSCFKQQSSGFYRLMTTVSLEEAQRYFHRYCKTLLEVERL